MRAASLAGVQKGLITTLAIENICAEIETGLLRCGKSCRLRWTNYLRPDLKRGLLSDAEEKLVIDLHAQLGNRCGTMHFLLFWELN